MIILLASLAVCSSMGCLYLLHRFHKLVPTKRDVERQGIQPSAEYTLTSMYTGRIGPQSPHVQMTISGRELGSLLAYLERLSQC